MTLYFGQILHVLTKFTSKLIGVDPHPNLKKRLLVESHAYFPIQTIN